MGFEPTRAEHNGLERQLPTARPAKCFSFSQSRLQILKQLEPITFAQSKTFHQSRQKSWRDTSGSMSALFWRADVRRRHFVYAHAGPGGAGKSKSNLWIPQIARADVTVNQTT